MFKTTKEAILQSEKNFTHLMESWNNFLDLDTYLIYTKEQDFLKKISKPMDVSWIFRMFFKIFYKIEIDKEKFSNLKKEITEYNDKFIQTRKIQYSSFFIGKDDKTKYSLDLDQILAVIKDDKHNLVIAGAGSGKTSVITSRIAYLTRRKDIIKPEKILALAFTKVSAQEMQDRLKRDYKLDINISTFHALGNKIISMESNKKPQILFDGSQPRKTELIRNIFDEVLQETKYQNYVLDYILFHSEQEIEEDSFADKKLYFRYMENKKYSTLNDIEVKSISERNIGNFLFRHNIEFKYERIVDWIDIANDTENKKYRPDFYLPEYDIYIEHWGLNEQLQVPDWFTISSQEYLDLREWKLAQFEKHEKKLIQTWDYQRVKGDLISNLILNLAKNIPDFDLKPIPFNELIEKTYNFREQKSEISNLVATFIEIAKSNFLFVNDISEKLESKKYSQKQKLFGEIALEVYKRYQSYLKEKNKIDFNDMINLAVDFAKKTQ